MTLVTVKIVVCPVPAGSRSTSKYGSSSVAAGATVTSQESSLLTEKGEAANADVAMRSSTNDRYLMFFLPRRSILCFYDIEVSSNFSCGIGCDPTDRGRAI